MQPFLLRTATFAIADVTRSNDSNRQDGRKGTFPCSCRFSFYTLSYIRRGCNAKPTNAVQPNKVKLFFPK